MSSPTPFREANTVLRGDGHEILDLPVHHEPAMGLYTSCWRFTPEELEEIRRTGVAYIQMYAERPPAVYLAGISPFKEQSPTVTIVKKG